MSPTPSSQPNPAILLSDTPAPSQPLLTLLHSHLPHSLPLLRRLQFALRFTGGRGPHTHVLYARWPGPGDGPEDRDRDADRRGLPDREEEEEEEEEEEGEEEDPGMFSGGAQGGHFAAACVDLSRGPETQVWVYSSLERAGGLRGGDGGSDVDVDGGGGGGGGGHDYRWAGRSKAEEAALDLLLSIFQRIRAIAATGDPSPPPNRTGDATEKGKILVGSLHETLRQGLLARGVGMDKSLGIPVELDWEFCGKWLFRVEDLPVPGGREGGLPAGMRWDTMGRGDVAVVQARTSIKRQEATLLMLPSTVVRLEDGTPVAWAFLGLDGTIITLHVEEPYRRLGIAKALACKLMREHLRDYGDDGWGAADVFIENHKSQALCRSIGGKNSWTLSWAVVDLFTVGDPM